MGRGCQKQPGDRIKDLDREIKARKTEAKKILLLEEKVNAQRQIKEMEKTRNALRMSLTKPRTRWIGARSGFSKRSKPA